MEHDGDFQREKRRKLSSAEQKRMDRFEQVSAELEQQGYAKHELTVGIVRANVFALVLAVPLCIAAIVLFHAANLEAPFWVERPRFIMLFGAYIGLIVVHELVHGITWSIFAGNGWHDIDFGFMKEYLTPYCTCSTPLPRGGYIVGALMPLIVLGIVPTIIAIAIGSAFFLYIGLLMVISAGGDMLIVYTLLGHRSGASEQLIYDHPTQAGCVVFER